MTFELLQQLPVYITDIQPPHSHQSVVAAGHHQVLGHGMVPSRIHKGRMRQHFLGCSQKPFYIPLTEGEENAQMISCVPKNCHTKHAVSLVAATLNHYIL